MEIYEAQDKFLIFKPTKSSMQSGIKNTENGVYLTR